MLNPITPTQRRVLECMRDWRAMWGSMPTRAEISEVMGWKSANAAEDALRALQRRGLIDIRRGTVRGLQFTAAGQQLLAAASPMPRPEADLIALPVVDMARINRRAVIA